MANRIAVAVVLLISWPFSLQLAKAGTITYDLTQTTSLQDGWTVTGTVTTNGATGTLVSGDVESWGFTLFNGKTSYAASSTDEGSSTVLNGVMASATGITLPDTADSEDLANELLLQAGSTFIEYNRQDGPTAEIYKGAGAANLLWDADNAANIGGTDPWTLATAESVPEPSSIVLLGVASIGIIGLVWRRRRASV